MQSKATTVAEYLGSLPEDRRTTIESVRDVILRNLDADYEEGMQYGMIGYYVPHRIFPAGYHCDPKQPLPFAGLASQKNHLSFYLMCLYGDTDHYQWFTKAWAATGRKLDMGKCCIRFRKIEDLAIDVLGEAIRRIPAKAYIQFYEAALRKQSTDREARKADGKSTKSAKPTKPTRGISPTKPRKSPRE